MCIATLVRFDNFGLLNNVDFDNLPRLAHGAFVAGSDHQSLYAMEAS
jgi:hypothetical protein